MFELGDNIIYGNNRVCKVENIGTLNLPGIPKDKQYYTLQPLFRQGSTIFTPVDNEKVIMRPIMSKQEALELIDKISEIETLWITDEKRRESEYKGAFRSCDVKELVKIIKTIYVRKKTRQAEGKKITAGDLKYFRMAEDSLYEELSISLEMEKDEVRDFINARVEQIKVK